MAGKLVSVRLPEELLEWADAYAVTRGVSRTDLLVEGLHSFKADCEAGVPEIRERARAQSSVRSGEEDGVGVCPARGDGKGHVWTSWRVSPNRPCKFGCGVNGREPEVPGQENKGFFAQATRARMELYDGLRAPASSNGKPRSS